MFRNYAMVFFMVFSNYSYSECWKIGDFHGVSAKADEGYEIKKDGLSNQIFMLQISDAKTAIIPNDLSCKAVSSTSAICLNSDNQRSVVETWSVDPIKGVAFYTKAIRGYAIFDGPSLFIGKILGPCN